MATCAYTQPDRYLGDHYTNAESANLADPMLRDHWMFGAGCVLHFCRPGHFTHIFTFHFPTRRNLNAHSRRICPGIALAEQEIFLAVAHLLWAFRMEELPEEPIDLKEYDGLSGRSPVPFRIKMTPRDGHVAEMFGLAGQDF